MSKHEGLLQIGLDADANSDRDGFSCSMLCGDLVEKQHWTGRQICKCRSMKRLKELLCITESVTENIMAFVMQSV